MTNKTPPTLEQTHELRPEVRLDVAVIGAGVVGLAIARELALRGREVVVFEAEQRFGMHTSSRNSEVIHSGIHYRPQSLKAQLCVRGRQILYQFCREQGIAHKKLGKIIVATSDGEIPKLENLKKTGETNGVDDLTWLTPKQVQEMEPTVRCVSALYSPSTGIIDSHGLMVSLKREATENRAWVQVSSPVVEGEVQSEGIALAIGGREQTTALCQTVINCAGLQAPNVARKIKGLPQARIPNAHFAKGHYFALRRQSPFSHLVYPVPVQGGLGIHVTLDMEGNARFGPDVSWVGSISYGFDESRAPSFYEAIRTYYPSLSDEDLQPGFTGIRPKLGPEGSEEQDFHIQGPEGHGIAGLVNLFGIESPGLTSCLAIAEHVASLLEPR